MILVATLSVESRNCVIKIMTNHVPCQNYYLNLDIKSVHRTCLLYHRISNFEIFLNIVFKCLCVDTRNRHSTKLMKTLFCSL
jgi:hypothetical protein